jgi:hypothetical protein
MDRNHKDRLPAVLCIGAAVDNEGLLQDKRGPALPARLNSMIDQLHIINEPLLINHSLSPDRISRFIAYF